MITLEQPFPKRVSAQNRMRVGTTSSTPIRSISAAGARPQRICRHRASAKGTSFIKMILTKRDYHPYQVYHNFNKGWFHYYFQYCCFEINGNKQETDTISRNRASEQCIPFWNNRYFLCSEQFSHYKQNLWRILSSIECTQNKKHRSSVPE